MPYGRTWKPTTAGVVSIVAGAIHFIGWSVAGLGLSFFTIDRSSFSRSPGFPTLFIWLVLIPAIALAVLAIIGGIYAMQRRNWGLALAGAIAAIFGPITWWLGVFATVLIVLSRDEFRRPVVTTSIDTPPPPLPPHP